MISKYRNRSWAWFVFAVILSVTAGLTVRKISHTRVDDRTAGMIALAVISYIGSWISWVLVGFSLARAKGYSKDFIGTLFTLVYLVGLCFPIIVVAFPLYILFGMEDKAKDQSRRRR